MSMLHIFDMDGTLLPGTTACAEIARHCDTSEALTAIEEAFTAHGNTVDFACAIADLWKHLDEVTVDAAFRSAPTLHNISDVMSDIGSRGEHAVLITMAPDFFANHFTTTGLRVFASRFPTLPFTTALDTTGILKPEDKPRLAQRLCNELDISRNAVIAYGDSSSDIPLFQWANNSVAVNATPTVKALARTAYEGDDLLEAYKLGRQLYAPVN